MLMAESVARLWALLATEPRHSLGWVADDLRDLLAAYDAQAAALRWAVETLDGYKAEMPDTYHHWMAGWADWLEQARAALEAPDGDG